MGAKNKTIRCLTVDAAAQKTTLHEISREDTVDRFGSLGVHFTLWHSIWQHALDDANNVPVVGISTGPLTGSGAPASGVFSMIWADPHTQKIVIRRSEGMLGSMLRYAGVDHLLIYGRAVEALYLHITDGIVSFISAEKHRESDNAATYEWIIRHSDERDRVVVSAGPFLYAQSEAATLLENKAFEIGGFGSGAIFEQMNLKALSVAGRGRVKLADAQEFLNLCIKLYAAFPQKTGYSASKYLPEIGYYLSPWKSKRVAITPAGGKVLLSDKEWKNIEDSPEKESLLRIKELCMLNGLYWQAEEIDGQVLSAASRQNEGELLSVINKKAQLDSNLLENADLDAIIFALLGLGWADGVPYVEPVDDAARLLSKAIGEPWNSIQLTESARRVVRINGELHRGEGRKNGQK
ncbi:MAG TPA: hypothetical protein GX404_07670 [Syntrophomonadaceae bacterium]|nr:hypothetical protein [Syntrophomonadaceae bacterium]